MCESRPPGASVCLDQIRDDLSLVWIGLRCKSEGVVGVRVLHEREFNFSVGMDLR